MYQLSRLFLCAMLASTIACGASKSNNQTSQVDETNGRQGQIFRFMGETATLSALDENGAEIEVDLTAQDHIAISGEQITTEDGDVWVAAVIDRNDDSDAQTIYFKPQDVLNLPIALMTIDNDADWVDVDSSTVVETTVDIGGVLKTIPVLRVERMTYCYKYVKLYLQKIGLVKAYLPGGSAWMAAGILPKYGFKKVSRKPSQAIVNDVCVYKGGPSGHGHIEIRTSKGWYYGYGYKSKPIQNRIFMGCFHK